MCLIKKVIKIDPRYRQKSEPGMSLISFRYEDHTLGFQITGGKWLLSSLPSLQFFFCFFSIYKTWRKKNNVLSKMTHYKADFARFRGTFFSITHYLLDFSEQKKTINKWGTRMWFPRHWRSWLRSFFFRFVVFQKLLSENKLDIYIALHGLYVLRRIIHKPTAVRLRAPGRVAFTIHYSLFTNERQELGL